MTRAREGLVLGYAERSVGGALQHPSPFLEEARAALDAPWEERAEELFGPDETLHATFTTLRDELLRSIPRTGGRLGELRLDTDLDVAHGAVRYLELVKLAALIDRPEPASRWPMRCRGSTPRCSARPPPSSARSCRPARSTRCCSTPSTTRAPARPPSPRARSPRWSPSCPPAATGCCSAPPTSRPTARAR